jgi:transposase
MAKTRPGRRNVAALEARRFEAARLFARGTGQAAVMRALGVSRQTAHQWYHRWRRGGRQGLKAVGRLGRKPRLDQRQLSRVEAALLQGPRRHGFATDLWTLPRVATVIARLTGVHYHPGHVWYLLRGLQWSLQRPARRARERDEAAIRQWVSRRWPAVKKTPGASGPGSSSRTKAGSRSSPSSGAPGPRAGRPLS